CVVEFDLKHYPVLFVDDEPDIIETFVLNYQNEFTVFTALGGAEAIAVLERERVDVLVADQRMPGMPGIDVIRRALELRPGIVPIILTGYTDLEVLIDALNLGRVHGYLSKPWDSRELRLAITRAIESCHLAAENERLTTENARLVDELKRANATLAAQ